MMDTSGSVVSRVLMSDWVGSEHRVRLGYSGRTDERLSHRIESCARETIRLIKRIELT